MNTILPGGIFKTFGVIFNDLEEKFDSSAAMLSWIPSISVALALMLGEFRDLYSYLMTKANQCYI